MSETPVAPAETGGGGRVVSRYGPDYYERVADTMGPRKTREFMRYYLVPGANHANFGTPAFAASWDSLTAIEQWVEQEREPAAPVVTDASDGRTRPLCEYPLWPKYRTGDPDSAESFVCALR